MAYKTLLLHADDEPRFDERLQLAAGIARNQGARLDGLFVIPPLVTALPISDPAAVLGQEILEQELRRQRARADRVAGRFQAAAAGLEAGAAWAVVEGDPADELAERSRYADLTVLGQTDVSGLATLAPQVPERVVMLAGGPVLVVPYAGTASAPFRRIVIAWSGTRESARAAADALPFLVAADHVTVLEIDPPAHDPERGSRLAERLQRQGVRAEAHHTVSGSIGTGEALLSALADQAADLLVMGAYGHARIQELVLGGVSRTIFAHMTVPVLFSA